MRQYPMALRIVWVLVELVGSLYGIWRPQLYSTQISLLVTMTMTFHDSLPSCEVT
jgi:hypothetical protein